MMGSAVRHVSVLKVLSGCLGREAQIDIFGPHKAMGTWEEEEQILALVGVRGP